MSSEYFSIEEDYGSLEGYIVNSKDESYRNFIQNEVSDNVLASKLISFIEGNNYENILVIKNINVGEDYQGNGYGKEMLENALGNCSVSILISDKYEEQRENFNLERFYETSNFIKMGEGSSGGLMAYPSEEFIKLKELLVDEKQEKRANRIKPRF